MSATNHDHHDHHHDHPHDHDHKHDHDHEHAHRAGIWARLRHQLTPHSHDASAAIQTAAESSGQGIRTAWIGLAGMMITAALQLVIVAVSGSVALLADTLHNLGHAVTTMPLVIAFKLGMRSPTKRYPYGFRRAEDLVGVLISLVIAASVVLIVIESIGALVHPRPLTNLGWVFAAGLVGAVGNELVAWYRIRTGRRIGSAALVAEGQHARADGLTSIAVVLGVIGVWLGFPQADAVMGLLIALAMVGILVSSVRTIGRRLLDGVEPGLIDQLTAVAAAVPGVEGVDRIRARWSGHRIEADAAIAVAPEANVREGHAIAERVEHELLHRIPSLDSVVIHLHPALPADADRDDLHELTGHHASPEARAAYRARVGSGTSAS